MKERRRRRSADRTCVTVHTVTHCRRAASNSISQGRWGEAVLSLCQAVEIDPRDAPTLQQLGSALFQLGHYTEAEHAFYESLTLNPLAPGTWYEFANLLHFQGRLEEASCAYERTLRLDPTNVSAIYNRGVTHLLKGSPEEALQCFSAAALADPSHADAHNNRGILLQLAGDLSGAIESYRLSLKAAPRSTQAGYNLGLALQSAGQLEEALDVYRRVVRIEPDNASAHNNLGNVLMALGEAERATSHYTRAIEHDPANLEALWNLGVARLLVGDFERGWEGYEHRLVQAGTATPQLDKPRWMGEALKDRRILLHSEQGLGDTVQFSRFVPVLARQGAVVYLACQKPLLPLMQHLPGLEKALPALDGLAQDLPEYDYHLPLMSVPRVLATRPETIPAENPYLTPDPAIVERWRLLFEELGGKTVRRRIGLSWAGNPRHKNDANRSMPFQALEPLLALPGVHFFSLQKGDAVHQMGPAARDRIVNLEPRLTNLEETAAAMSQLDLVISVDTVVAHLAGAVGRPVWLMLPHAPDWRWMLGRSDSPWYPTMRLWRQAVRGDWTPLVEEMCRELAQPVVS